jgi:hypothetical protein
MSGRGFIETLTMGREAKPPFAFLSRLRSAD